MRIFRGPVVTLHCICNQDVEEAADRRKEENAVENCDLKGNGEVVSDCRGASSTLYLPLYNTGITHRHATA